MAKVFVGSLPVGTKPRELRHLFQSFGIVIECDVMNRCGFIHMETPAMAETAILALHGSEFKGQTIVVEPGRSKDKDQDAIESPPLPNMICADDQGIEGPIQIPPNDGNHGGMRNRGGAFGGPRRGMPMGNRGGGGMPNRGGMRNQFGMPNRGGINMRGGGGGMGQQPFNRGGGMGNRGGMGGNPFAGVPRGGGMGSNMNLSGRGGFRGRGGGGNDNRSQNDGGPMRNSPNFKSRPGPYPLMGGGGPPNDHSRGGRFGGNQRGGFGGPNRSNTRFNDNNQYQRENNWNRNEDDSQGGPPHEFTGNMGNDGGHFRGKGNFMHNNAGQDRRGFTLANTPQQEQNQFGNNRPPMDRNNSFRGNDQRADGAGFQPRFNGNMRGGPNQQRGRGGGRGNFGGGRGGGGNFGGSDGPTNNYNKEFPALAPVRGRGGFGGNRGGFNRNAPNMMPNHR